MALAYADLLSYVSGQCYPQAKIALRDSVTGAWPTDDAINALIGWAITDALFGLNYPPVSPTAVVDTDLANVPDALTHALMLSSTIQAKRRIRGNLNLIDATQGSTKQFLSQLAVQIDREITDLEADYVARYGKRPAAPAITPMTSAPDVGAGGIVRGPGWPVTTDGGPPISRPPDPYGGFEFA